MGEPKLDRKCTLKTSLNVFALPLVKETYFTSKLVVFDLSFGVYCLK